MSRLRAALAEPVTTRLPCDHGELAMLESSYGYLRQFTPDVLDVIEFAGSPTAAPLLEAVGVLRELNATGARMFPTVLKFAPAMPATRKRVIAAMR